MKPIVFASPPQRILIIKPSAIGDVVHALPVLNLLRRHWPAAKIAWLVTPACAGILDRHPMLDEVIHFDRRGLARWWRHWPTGQRLRQFHHALRERRFDLVIDLQGLFRSGWLAWQTRAPVRIGFASAREAAPLFYTHRVRVGTPDQHAIHRYLKVLAALGVPTDPVQFPFAVDEDDRRHVAKLLGDDRPYAVLLPGTNWATKRWPVAYFSQLGQTLREKHGLRTVVAGSPGERELGERINDSLNLCGQTTLRQLVALLERASLVIANDSGPMHIAAALGRPMLTLFGPTNPIRTGPFARDDTVVRLDIPCHPCYSRTCSHQSCLQHLTPDRVEPLVELQIRNHR